MCPWNTFESVFYFVLEADLLPFPREICSALPSYWAKGSFCCPISQWGREKFFYSWKNIWEGRMQGCQSTHSGEILLVFGRFFFQRNEWDWDWVSGCCLNAKKFWSSQSEVYPFEVHENYIHTFSVFWLDLFGTIFTALNFFPFIHSSTIYRSNSWGPPNWEKDSLCDVWWEISWPTWQENVVSFLCQ